MLEELSKIGYLERRFLTALLMTLLMSYTIRNRTKTYSLLSAILILYIAFDYKHTIYIMASVLVNVVLLKFLVLSEYTLTALNMMILYIYKIFGMRFEDRISGSFDISGVLMLMTIKMCYLGKEYDVHRDTVKDIMSYMLFIPGLMLGPVPTFESFRINRYKKPKKFPYGAFLRSLVFLFLFQVLRTAFPRESLFAEKRSLIGRIINLYLFNIANRIKFYFAWHFSHGCFTFQNFPDLLNVDFMKVELATSIKDLATYWNICTGTWLKNCFFIPLKDRSIFWASIVTAAASALWHGINPCYLIMFLSFSIFTPVVKENNRLIQRFCPSLFWILSRVQVSIFVTYFSTSFFLLNLADLIHIWKSVYFIGHIVFTLSMVVQLSLGCFLKTGMKRKTE